MFKAKEIYWHFLRQEKINNMFLMHIFQKIMLTNKLAANDGQMKLTNLQCIADVSR